MGDEEVEVLGVAEVTVVAMEELGGAAVAMMVVGVVAVLAVAAVVLAVVLVGEGGEVAVEGVGIDPPP